MSESTSTMLSTKHPAIRTARVLGVLVCGIVGLIAAILDHGIFAMVMGICVGINILEVLFEDLGIIFGRDGVMSLPPNTK